MWKLVLGKHNLTSPVSSYSRPEVITKTQSYFFTHSVKAMAVTSTAKGITSKQLLIGTIGDQVRKEKFYYKLLAYFLLVFLTCCITLLRLVLGSFSLPLEGIMERHLVSYGSSLFVSSKWELTFYRFWHLISDIWILVEQLILHKLSEKKESYL